MTTYVPPKKNDAAGWIGYVSLAPRTATGAWQSNPTLAAGDVKVSIDGGALANLGTLPAVTPASSKLVKITLSQAEINGDNIAIIFSDAAGAEWCDKTICLQTTARQIDDLAFPTTSGRSLDVTATGAAGIDWGNVENPTTALNLSATNIDVDQVVASVSGAVGSVTGLTAADVGAIKAKTDNLPSDPADASVISGRFDSLDTSVADLPTNAELATALGTADDAVLAQVALVKAKTDNLPTDPADQSLIIAATDAIIAAIAALNNLSAAQVNAEVLDVLNVDTFSLPAQGAPSATPTLRYALLLLYKALRNRVTQDASEFAIYADDGTTKDHEAVVSDSGTLFDRGELGTGA